MRKEYFDLVVELVVGGVMLFLSEQKLTRLFRAIPQLGARPALIKVIRIGGALILVGAILQLLFRFFS